MRRYGWIGAASFLLGSPAAIAQSEKVQEAWMPPKPAAQPQKNWGFGPRAKLSNPWRVRAMGEPTPVVEPIPATPTIITLPRHGPTSRFDHLSPRDRVLFTTGSGLSIRGDYSSDRFRLGFSLGSPVLGVSRTYRHDFRSSSFVGGCVGGSCNDYFSDRDPVDGFRTTTYIMADPAVMSPGTPAPVASPPTILDQARAAHAEAEFEDAIRLYRAHLDAYPDDASTMRLLGSALVRAGRTADGIAIIHLAYTKSPALARTPLDLDFFGRRQAAELRRLVNTCVTVAHRDKTAQAWLAVVVFMQAEGRNEPARSMLDRARGIGLDDKVADALENELAG